MLDVTGNLKAAQKSLGHSSIQTTGDIYADWDIDQPAATMAQMPGLTLSELFPLNPQIVNVYGPMETVGIEPTSAIACEWLLRA